MAEEEAETCRIPLLPHQSTRGNASACQTIFNIIVSIVGTGILSLPFAFKTAGWLSASAAVVIAGASTLYCMLLLIECKNTLEAKGIPSVAHYSDLGFIAFGSVGRAATEFLVTFSQAGGCIAYLVFIGQNLSSLSSGSNSSFLNSSSFFILCLAPVEIVLSSIRSLSSLSLFSFLADLFNVLAMAIVVREDFQLFDGFSKIAPTTTIAALPFAAGVAVFCFEGFCMTIPLEVSMKTPKKFKACLTGAFAGITAVYVGFGFCGYLAYGDKTAEIVTLNLPDGWSTTAVKIGLCITLVFTFPMMMHPIHEIIECRLRRIGLLIAAEDLKEGIVDWRVYFWRGAVVLLLAAVASFVYGFGAFVSFVGSTVCALLSFILPAAFHLRLAGEGLGFWRKALDFGLLGVGIVFACHGIFQAVFR